MEKFAELEEYNITCLADGEILYARTEEDAERFRKLKKRQADKSFKFCENEAVCFELL